ncbi:MAG: hypothetical protein NTY76_05165 [Candidatus Omnitrophica bacterium]|nr:hypothetical protein [Candidatus Omnitrophota bacterium]
MWYLIGVIAIALVGFFLYANAKKNKRDAEKAKAGDKPPFRTEEKLSSYNKPMDNQHSHVDFDDAE